MNKMIVLTLYNGKKIVIGIDDIKIVIESDGINSGKYNSYLSDVIKNNPDIFGVDLDKE